MTYAIVGSGAIGKALGLQFARKAIPIKIANSRGPASMARLKSELGSSVYPVELSEALASDIVILAVPFTAVKEVVKGAPSWGGRIVIDATNAINFANFTPMDLGGKLSSELVAEAVPGATLVKAFNTLPAAILSGLPENVAGRRVIFLSSNDAAASNTGEGLIKDLGFAPIGLGKIDEGGRLQQFGGPLTLQNLMKQS